MTSLSETLWPTLEDWRPAELSEIRNGNHDEMEDIRSADWSNESALALEEARRIAKEEEDRSKTAESKASNLLLVAAALVPLLTSLETAVWDAKMGTAPKWISLPVLAVAVVYLCWAALWSLRVIAASNYVRVYHADLVHIWKDRQEIKKKLATETMLATRLNQDTINKKVSALRMAHAFLFRAILAFCLLLLVQASFELWAVLFPHFTGPIPHQPSVK